MSDLYRQSFSWRGYSNFLDYFLTNGYTFKKFSLSVPSKGAVYLRHDIDFCLESAVRAAEVEHKLGIQSTFFFLLGTEFYNIFSSNGSKALCDIIDMGHNVGLHFDASKYLDDPNILDAAAQNECSILEQMIGREVDLVSFHRPSSMFLGSDRYIGGRIHTYMPTFFSLIPYFSDSRGLFRFGHPFDSSSFRARQSMQILTHPIWWSDVEPEDRLDLIDCMLQRRRELLSYEAARNCIPYRDRIPNNKT